MTAFSKYDCHDDYIMCAIDKAVKHLEVQRSKIMVAFSKDDCHDDYIMCAIDKAVKYLG